MPFASLAAVPAGDPGQFSPEIGLLLVALLVLANGFFVAAEFGLVAVRRSRIDHLAAQGDTSARTVQKAIQHLDRYISGTQLGITLSSLALGWIGEPALAALIDRGLSALGFSVSSQAVHSAAAITAAFLVITFLHIVLGELAPKSLALTKPEAVSKLVARPLMIFSTIGYPVIWVLNGAAGTSVRRAAIRLHFKGKGVIQGHEPLRRSVALCAPSGGPGAA